MILVVGLVKEKKNNSQHLKVNATGIGAGLPKERLGPGGHAETSQTSAALPIAKKQLFVRGIWLQDVLVVRGGAEKGRNF